MTRKHLLLLLVGYAPKFTSAVWKKLVNSITKQSYKKNLETLISLVVSMTFFAWNFRNDIAAEEVTALKKLAEANGEEEA